MILENNIFFFNETMHTQVQGTAMGAKFAPTYATLVLTYLEEKLYSEIKQKMQFSLRKLETIFRRLFCIWTKSKDDLKTFHLILNHLNPNLSFTMENCEEKLPFLDILLLKNNSRILTYIYSKETDSKQYLNYNSCHPKHTKTSIP